MANVHEIRSEKILVKDIFSTMWFRIPEYQRPYIWSSDEVNELLDDLTFANKEKPDHEYFLGSFVFQSKKANSELGMQFDENDLLDGQQRMTTLLMLFACIRDLAQDEEAKKDCQSAIYQKGSQYRNIPERNRLVYAIRQSVQDFVDQFIKTDGGTNREVELKNLAKNSGDTSVQNMASAILVIRQFFNDPENGASPESLLKFLMNYVLFIYVATQDLEDAFRLFMILNDRGVPLRNSDILKSMNLGELSTDAEKIRYAKMWEEAESEMGDEFDRFLSHLRTILVKDKARLNLLQEYEDKIYNPKEKDKSTGKRKKALLQKGKPTFEYIERYLKHYNKLFDESNYEETGDSFEFDNLVKVMETGLPSNDWMPPLLRYFDRFRHEKIFDFLTKLDNKFSSDWIAQYTPTYRIQRMNLVIEVIETAADVDSVLNNDCFAIDGDGFMRTVESTVYGRRFTRFILLKLDYYFHDHSHPMPLETLSVEHILPQNPTDDSQWKKDFDNEYRAIWTDKLGNLVLISTRKNSSQGRLDYSEKKDNYFKKRISSCPNSLRVLQANDRWTPYELEANHELVVDKIRANYSIAVDSH